MGASCGGRTFLPNAVWVGQGCLPGDHVDNVVVVREVAVVPPVKSEARTSSQDGRDQLVEVCAHEFGGLHGLWRLDRRRGGSKVEPWGHHSVSISRTTMLTKQITPFFFFYYAHPGMGYPKYNVTRKKLESEEKVLRIRIKDVKGNTRHLNPYRRTPAETLAQIGLHTYRHTCIHTCMHTRSQSAAQAKILEGPHSKFQMSGSSRRTAPKLKF